MQILTRQDLIAGRAHCCKDCKGAEKLRAACLQKQNLYNTLIRGNRIKSRTWCLLYWLSRPTQVSEIKVTRIDEVSRPAKASPLLRQGETVPLQLHDGDSLQLSTLALVSKRSPTLFTALEPRSRHREDGHEAHHRVVQQGASSARFLTLGSVPVGRLPQIPQDSYGESSNQTVITVAIANTVALTVIMIVRHIGIIMIAITITIIAATC